jgi:DNA relaxase NicK
MTRTKITKHVDWIGATYPADITPQQALPLLDWKRTGEGPHGHRHRHFDSITGARFDSGASERQGNQLQISGSALSEMRSYWNLTDDQILTILTAKNARVSRIDLAINLHEGTVTPQGMYKAYENGDVKAPIREYDLTLGTRDNIKGETFYLGSRTSERYVRVYDKAAEMKIVDGDAWVRFEMEMKGMKARAAVHAIAEHGVVAVINGQFQSFIKWNNREYNRAITGDSAEIKEQGRKETNAEKWLMNQVAKALAKQIYLRRNFRHDFNDRVNFYLDELYRQS